MKKRKIDDKQCLDEYDEIIDKRLGIIFITVAIVIFLITFFKLLFRV